MSQPLELPSIYQLRITLREISPLIWRRLLVCSGTTLAQLHIILQIVFDWSGEHLLDAGVDVAFVQDRLGHANIQNTIDYMRYTTVTRDAQTRQLFASHRVV